MASNPMLAYVLDPNLAMELKQNGKAQYLFEKYMGDKKVWIFADVNGLIKAEQYSFDRVFFTDKMTFGTR